MLNMKDLSADQKARYDLLIEKPEWRRYVEANQDNIHYIIGYTYKFGSASAKVAMKGTKYGGLSEAQLCDMLYLLEYSLHCYGIDYNPQIFEDQVFSSMVEAFLGGAK